VNIEINTHLGIARGTLPAQIVEPGRVIKQELNDRGFNVGDIQLWEDLLNDCTCFKARIEPKPVAGVKLQPCPFCGCDPVEEHHDASKIASIRCTGCGATILGVGQEATEKWNMRIARYDHDAL